MAGFPLHGQGPLTCVSHHRWCLSASLFGHRSKVSEGSPNPIVNTEGAKMKQNPPAIHVRMWLHWEARPGSRRNPLPSSNGKSSLRPAMSCDAHTYLPACPSAFIIPLRATALQSPPTSPFTGLWLYPCFYSGKSINPPASPSWRRASTRRRLPLRLLSPNAWTRLCFGPR
jgi:hypothetical protein